MKHDNTYTLPHDSPGNNTSRVYSSGDTTMSYGLLGVYSGLTGT